MTDPATLPAAGDQYVYFGSQRNRHTRTNMWLYRHVDTQNDYSVHNQKQAKLIKCTPTTGHTNTC